MILGVDHGKKRVGLAISDPTLTHAFPLECVPGKDRFKLISRIQELIVERGVTEVVVGLPLSLSGEEGSQAKRARQFGQGLAFKLEGLSVVYWDERFSSQQADRGRGGKKAAPGTRDLMAAVVILQSYLDSKSSVP